MNLGPLTDRLNTMIAAVIVGLTCSASFGSKPDTLGISAMGLGHVNSLTAKPWTFAATHPAGLIQCRQRTLSQGYSVSHFDKRIEGKHVKSQTTRGFEGGLCLPSTLWNLDAVLGIAWHLPDEHITSSRTQSPRGPVMIFFEDRLDRLVVASSLALGHRDLWGIGFGLEHLAITRGTVALRGELLLDELEQPNLEGTIDFLFGGKRRFITSAWVAIQSNLRWSLAYASALGLTIDLSLDFEGDVSSDPGSALLEDVSLILASHLYAYGTPPKWTSNLHYETDVGALSLEISLVNWNALEVPLPTSTVSTSLRDEMSIEQAVTNPMRSSWVYGFALSSHPIETNLFGVVQFHTGIRYDERITSRDQAYLIDTAKLHIGAALDYKARTSKSWPTISIGGRYIHGFQTLQKTLSPTYGMFQFDFSGYAIQSDLEWTW